MQEIRRVLNDAEYRREMVEHNYAVGREWFSYEVVEDELQLIIRRPQNLYRLSRRRIPTTVFG